MTQSREPWEGRETVKAAFLQWITAAQSCLKLTYSLCNFTRGSTHTHAAHNGGVTANSRNLADALTLCNMWTPFVRCCSFVRKAACLFKARHLLYEILFPFCLFLETCQRNGNKFFTGQTYKENCNLWYVSPRVSVCVLFKHPNSGTFPLGDLVINFRLIFPHTQMFILNVRYVHRYIRKVHYNIVYVFGVSIVIIPNTDIYRITHRD